VGWTCRPRKGRGYRSNAAGFLAQFNAAADEILPRIDSDMSKNANLLHSAIVNVRTSPGNLQVLEQTQRVLVLEIN
jgi:hypothetical protein